VCTCPTFGLLISPSLPFPVQIIKKLNTESEFHRLVPRQKWVTDCLSPGLETPVQLYVVLIT
jgi:hypothetical protein